MQCESRRKEKVKMTKNNVVTNESQEMDEGLAPEHAKARAKLEKMIRERGIKPMTIERLRAMGDLWPEDESVDDFIAAVREWRRDGEPQRLS
jgi:hypothetical protein